MKVRSYSVGDRGEISGGWFEGNGTIFAHYDSEDPFYKWFNKENNSYNISIIYFASKAIGGEILKVIEG